MKTTKKTSDFVKTVVAILKGDDAEVTALKILRQAESALKSQIHSLTGDTIALEDVITNAQESLITNRVNNGSLLADRTQYVEILLRTKNTITAAERALEVHLAKIKFLEEQLEIISK